jgi:pimeloyl-ACP methyl ester carboxylesterase
MGPGAVQISEERVSIAGIETFLRRTEGEGTPTLFVHGNPTHSQDWVPFMRALQGPALAIDLPNFGRSERPASERFDAGMHSYSRFVTAAVEELGLERLNLVVHDWGAIALHAAQRWPQRLERLVLINGVPLLSGYRWHWIARIWRRRGLGELFNATTTKRALALSLRRARPGYRAMPPELIEAVWSCWDRGTARAVLALYRSADPGALEAAGAHLERLGCPALILWGADDPYLGPELGPRYAARLPGAELVPLQGAGHWPWLDRPELVDRVAAYLS